MAAVVTLSIGANTYSVYALATDALADANAYMAAHLDAAEWTAAESSTKKQALVTAARAINRERWSGEQVDTVTPQPLAWPRTGATKDGVAVADGTPDDIALGQFEYALALIKDASLLDKTNTASNVKSVGAGPAKVEFFYPLPGTTTRWPVTVNDLLSGYLAGSAAGVDIVLPYAGSGESSFTSLDADRSEPYS